MPDEPVPVLWLFPSSKLCAMQSSSWALSWLVMAYVMMAHAAAQAVALLALDLVALLAAHSLGAWALSCRALPWLQVLAIVISPVTMSGESRLLCATASSALLLHHSIQRLGSQRHCTSDTIAFVILQLVLCPSTCFAPSSSSSVSDFFPRPSGLHWMLCCADWRVQQRTRRPIRCSRL